MKKLLLSLLHEIGKNEIHVSGPEKEPVELYKYAISGDGFPTPMTKPVTPDNEIEAIEE